VEVLTVPEVWEEESGVVHVQTNKVLFSGLFCNGVLRWKEALKIVQFHKPLLLQSPPSGNNRKAEGVSLRKVAFESGNFV